MRGLIEAYCRLASCDPEACAALFAPRAKLILTVAGRPLLLVGRARIREFLEQAPRALSFRTVACKRIGEDWIAEILVQGGPQPVYEGVRFTVRAGPLRRIRGHRRFRLMQATAPGLHGQEIARTMHPRHARAMGRQG